jgi:hypothetical protein
MEFPNSKLTSNTTPGAKPRNINPWTLARYWGSYSFSPKLTEAGRKWLIKELGRVDGGLDGITL